MASTTHPGIPATLGRSKAPARAAKRTLEQRLQGMLGMLSTQFLLGLALATVGDYDTATHTGNHAVHQILLILHVLVAIGILAGSIQLLVAAGKQAQKFTALAWVGLVAVLVSIASGLVRLRVDAEWLTFVMGTGFIVAVGVYGRLLGNVLKHEP